MRQRRVLTALAIPLVLAFVAASCGSDDSSSDGTTAPGGTEATETESTEATGDTTPVEAPEDVDTSVVENTDEVVMGGSVIMGLEAEATGLRPWEDSCSEPCYNIMRTIYDQLMEEQGERWLRPVPGREPRVERGLHRLDHDASSRHHVPQRHAADRADHCRHVPAPAGRRSRLVGDLGGEARQRRGDRRPHRGVHAQRAELGVRRGTRRRTARHAVRSGCGRRRQRGLQHQPDRHRPVHHPVAGHRQRDRRRAQPRLLAHRCRRQPVAVPRLRLVPSDPRRGHASRRAAVGNGDGHAVAASGHHP